MNWIDLKVDRPEIGRIVNIAIDQDVCSGFRVNGGWYIFTVQSKHFIPNGSGTAKVTHWMPLPEPPNEK